MNCLNNPLGNKLIIRLLTLLGINKIHKKVHIQSKGFWTMRKNPYDSSNCMYSPLLDAGPPPPPPPLFFCANFNLSNIHHPSRPERTCAQVALSPAGSNHHHMISYTCCCLFLQRQDGHVGSRGGYIFLWLHRTVSSIYSFHLIIYLAFDCSS